MGSSERDLKKICVGATVASGLPVRGCEAARSESRVIAWVKNMADLDNLMESEGRTI